MDAVREEKMKFSKRDIRVVLLHEYLLGHTATEAIQNICNTMGEDVLSARSGQLWFKRFKKGNYELDDLPRSGRPLEVDLNQLSQLIGEDPQLTTRCLAEQLGCSHVAVGKHLDELGKTWRYGGWIPHEISPRQRQHRVDTCMDLLTSHRNHTWLRNLITGDEKWVLYINHTHRRQWLSSGETGQATPKTHHHSKKVMLSVWWGVNGVIHWEILSNNLTITAELYCQQLDRVAEKLVEKYDKIYYLHDNARPHISKSTREKLLQLGWTTVPHPPYSPDLAPTDYHLFRSLSNYLREKKFDNENHLKSDLLNFFDSKPRSFYENGILSLPKRWQQVIDSNGAYINDS
jgi:histone-lysine N-methyltransferase SETMAR